MCVCDFWLVYVTEIKRRTFLCSLRKKKNKKRLTKRQTLLTNKQMNPEKKEEKERIEVGF